MVIIKDFVNGGLGFKEAEDLDEYHFFSDQISSSKDDVIFTFQYIKIILILENSRRKEFAN